MKMNLKCVSVLMSLQVSPCSCGELRVLLTAYVYQLFCTCLWSGVGADISVHLSVLVNYCGDTAPSPSNCTTESDVCSFRSAVATCSQLYADHSFADCEIALPSGVLTLCNGSSPVQMMFPTSGNGTFKFSVVGNGSTFLCIGAHKHSFLSVSSSNQSATFAGVT
jgi:hypothetical protein